MPLRNSRELATRSYVWDIADFAALLMLDNTKFSLSSPPFNRRSITELWNFLIFPNGKSYEDFIAFFLTKKNIPDQGVYNFTLSIGMPNATPVASHNFIGEQFMGRAIGEERFLCRKSNSWILNGPVRFRCDITEIGYKYHDLIHASFFNSSGHFNLEDTANLSLDLENLVKLPFHSDLTVDMSGNKMYIHKYMLRMMYLRFPNMRDLFRYSTVTEMPDSINIEINDQIFELLMHFIYTGKLGDSRVPLQLIRYAERFGLSSLIQCVHEPTYSNHVYSKGDVEEQLINWNLDELIVLEESSTCVHILRTTLYANQLAIQVSISDGGEYEKCIDVSFKFFGCREERPIILIAKISITTEAVLDAFKKEKHIFLQEDQWNFPRLQCQNFSNQGLRLTAELIMSEWTNVCNVKSLKTKTKLLTKFQTVADNLEYLRSSMAFLSKITNRTSNLVLLSDDNKSFRVHDGILWARWPGVRKLIDKEELADFVKRLELKVPSEVLKILINYFYTGVIKNFDREKAEMLLKFHGDLEYPDGLVKKCEALLSVDHEMG